jgi:cytochrome c oxidase subunit 2
MVDSQTNRLLSVDNALVVPVDVPITLSITAFDVIHSFALPQLGIKVDAIPGRVAQALLVVNYTGTYYGQCSELCGVYHGFMPIVLEVVSLESFFDWYTMHLGVNLSYFFMYNSRARFWMEALGEI